MERISHADSHQSGTLVMGKRDSAFLGAPLSQREQQVAHEIMKGHTNKEIAKTLGLGYETIKEHVGNILAKYGYDRRELIVSRLMKETLTAETLGKDFMKQFDQMAAAVEQTADELKQQVESMRTLVSTAMRHLNKKDKR
jgi:DNA-binding CsgD family transcriptional regulator